jgi:hypothetical protein
MTVKVYDSTGEFKGKARLKNITDPAGTATLTIAEQDDLNWTAGDLFDIYDVFELWTKFPRIIEDPESPGTLIFYRDWDITEASEEYPMEYTADRCIPIIGPSACAFLDDGVASVYFTAQHSYNVNSLRAPGWWSWAFQNGTPATSSSETPGNVTWAAVGTHRVDCQVSVNEPTKLPITAHRYVHVFERTGTNAPYTHFQMLSLTGSVSEGGWQAEFEVFDDVNVSEFPEGAQIILFAEEKLGEFAFGSEFDPEERVNIKYIGYILSGSVIKDASTKAVRFKTAGLHTLMKNRDSFGLALDYAASGAADTWYKQSGLNANYAFSNLLMWTSTVMSIADVYLPAYYYELWTSVSHESASHLAQYQDFEHTSLWQQLADLATDVSAQVIVDAVGRVSIMNDPQYTIEADLDLDLPEPYILALEDWITPITIDFADEPNTCVVAVEGIAFDGATATPIIGYYPGELPTYRGSAETKSRCILLSLSEAEFIAERMFAISNNAYSQVLLNCMGNYSFLDLLTYGGLQLSLDSNDTRYGIEWTAQRLFITGITNTIDSATGVLSTQLTLTPFATVRRVQPAKVV